MSVSDLFSLLLFGVDFVSTDRGVWPQRKK